MKGKALAIACTGPDEGMDAYCEKITGLIDRARVDTITAVVMEVPC